jgi:hypothetical protein
MGTAASEERKRIDQDHHLMATHSCAMRTVAGIPGLLRAAQEMLSHSRAGDSPGKG